MSIATTIMIPQQDDLDESMHPDGGSSHTGKFLLNQNHMFLKAVLGPQKSCQFLSRTDVWHGADPKFPQQVSSLFVQTAHTAFADHLPIALRPEVLWYMIMHEIAILVKSDPRRFAKLFHGDLTKKILVEVRDDTLVKDKPSDWTSTLGLFKEPLMKLVGNDLLNLFLPRFSTSTPESDIAILIAFMDTVSKYYEYKVFTRCHIPGFRLEGSVDDWYQLGTAIQALGSKFYELRDYLADVLSVVRELYFVRERGRGDEQFLRSFYKYEERSGTRSINGWINAFFAYQVTEQGFVLKEEFGWRNLEEIGGYAIDTFPSHISSVDFVWDYYGTLFPMSFVTGVFGVDRIDDFLTPRLGFGVYEK